MTVTSASTLFVPICYRGIMLNITTTIAEVVGKRLAATYRHYYGDQEAQFARLLDASARLIIERISTSDALYHNVEHTIFVTLVGEDILRGRLLQQPVNASDWLHFMFALLCHDIGYVRGVCSGDEAHSVVVDESGERLQLPRGASDASLTPYHVTRGKDICLGEVGKKQRFRWGPDSPRDRVDAVSCAK